MCKGLFIRFICSDLPTMFISHHLNDKVQIMKHDLIVPILYYNPLYQHSHYSIKITKLQYY